VFYVLTSSGDPSRYEFYQVAALRKSFGNDIELGSLHPPCILRLPTNLTRLSSPLGIGVVFVDAPHVLRPVDLTGHSATPDAFGAPEASATSEDPALQPRGWWLTDLTRTRTDGLEDSLRQLRDILRTQRFEVRHQSHKTWMIPLHALCGEVLKVTLASSLCFVGRLRLQVRRPFLTRQNKVSWDATI
jgi:Serine hydrolase (FSH1)